MVIMDPLTKEQIIAKYGTKTFVRSQDNVGLLKSECAGRPMTFEEVFARWDESDTLFWEQMEEYDYAIIFPDRAEPARTFLRQRVSLGLEQDTVAQIAGVSCDDIKHAEKLGGNSSIHVLDKIADAINLPRDKY